jgi:ring-1,2-phenylacetyl-CoA epoxidase subunit PaaE
MFHKLKIKNIRPETADCVSIALEVPTSLADIFQYKAGQYLTFKRTIEQEELRRSYSICSSPTDNELRVAIKKVPFGKFSTFANERLKEGDFLEVMPPNGRFTAVCSTENAKKYVGFAAGSGITPILSILKTVLRTEPKSHFTLIYGNQRRTSIIFKEAIEALKNQYIDRLSVYHVLSQEMTDATLLSGRIDAQKAQLFLESILKSQETDHFYICGPEEMTHAVMETLEKNGVEKSKIHFELFTSSKPNYKKITPQTVLDNSPKSEVTIRLDGSAFKMQLAYEGENILDEAMRHGADLPYACKGGVCCTCKAKLVEGEVVMTVNYGLEADEIAAGFILTCQAHPRTPKVVVDFDLK